MVKNKKTGIGFMMMSNVFKLDAMNNDLNNSNNLNNSIIISKTNTTEDGRYSSIFKIRDRYFFKNICTFMYIGKKLDVVKKSKKAQNLLHIEKDDYKKYCSYSLEIRLENELYANTLMNNLIVSCFKKDINGKYINNNNVILGGVETEGTIIKVAVLKKSFDIFKKILYNKNLYKKSLDAEIKKLNTSLMFVDDYDEEKELKEKFNEKSLEVEKISREIEDNKKNNIHDIDKIDSIDFTYTGDIKQNGLFMDLNNVHSINIKGKFYILDASNMFKNCTNLLNTNIDGANTVVLKDMSSMFFNCKKIKDIALTNFNTSKVNNMSYMFYSCTSLNGLDLTGFDTSKVENMSNMFNNCTSLNELNLKSFDTSKVKDMSFMFNNCNNLQTIYITRFSNNNVTNMKNMFSTCHELKNIDFNNFFTINVINMEKMFYNCVSFGTINLKNFDTHNVQNMSNMFGWCSNLKTIEQNFNTSNVTDMSYMFYMCDSLDNLDLHNFNTSKVINMEEMFSGCSALNKLNISNFNVDNVINKENITSHCKKNITKLVLSKFKTNKSKI